MGHRADGHLRLRRRDAVRRRPPRLLLARSKTTATQHVAARRLDHTFEKLASAHLQLVVAAPLVDALHGSPTEPLALPNHAHHLPLRLHRRGAFPLSLMLITPAAELLAVTTSPAAASAGSSERWGDGNRESCTSTTTAAPTPSPPHTPAMVRRGTGRSDAVFETILTSMVGGPSLVAGDVFAPRTMVASRGGGKEGVAAVPAVIVSPLPCTLELASRSSLTGRRRKEEEIKGEL
uniref:Uncharacterized protein n=1 Tax=Oryza nivara TaxID=4536 RepID=A0A0E0H6E8_ORYNI